MPDRTLHRRFARRMLPLAALAGLVVAVAPPLSYRIVAWQKLGAQAQIYAEHIAVGVRAAAVRQPYLWRYNTDKVVQATTAHRRQRDIGSVRITDCAGATLFAPERLAVGTGAEGGPSGWAPVVVRDRTVARVEVRMDPGAEHATLAWIAAASTALGLFTGALLFLFPTRVVRRQSLKIADTMRRLEAAEDRLKDVNRGLAGRVAAEVQKVRKLSERVVGIQEEERGRIARDLHDSVGQSLTALQLELESALGRAEETPSHAREGIRMCREALMETRRVVRDLRPPELGHTHLEVVLRSCAERFEERTGVIASFRADGGPVTDEETVTCLLRVLQEALTNVSRHAAASEVGVTLTAGGGTVSLTVHDDGKGFDPGGAGQGFGLRSMEERCTFLGGSLAVRSSPGEGTTISARLPLKEGA